MEIDVLLRTVQDAFTRAGGDDLTWPDPHPDHRVQDEEYSRVSDPAKYRIVAVRTAAWVSTLTDAGLATAESITDPRAPWRTPPADLAELAVATRLRPAVREAVPLLLCRNRVDADDHEYLLVGAGEPAVEVARVPDCGCDACDSGAADLLEVIDRRVLDLVTGALTHITLPHGTICGRDDGWTAGWTGSAGPGREEIETLLREARVGRCPHPVVHGPAWW